MRDIVSTFRNVSTKADHAQWSCPTIIIVISSNSLIRHLQIRTRGWNGSKVKWW
jgi:hypothetical protein